MTHTPLLTLLLVIAGNFCYGQAAPPPRFFLESGVEQPLDQGAISSASAGKIIFPFNFQATVIDQTTGLYIKTELFTSYSLTEHGVDPGAYGIEWVYGGEFSGPKPQVISFDKNTGEGLAAAVLRINRVDNDGIWGHFEPGLNELTLYWGSSQEVYHNNFSPPTLPAGSSTYLVTAAQPEIEIAVADNRVLYSQQAGTIVVVALPKPYPRTFDLWTDNPAVADVPATFQIAAGEELAFITFSPLAKGSGHMFASEQGALAVVPPTFSSHKFGIFGRPRRWVREGNTAMNEGDGFGGIRCLAGGPSTPEGNSEPDDEETFCGSCGISPDESDCRPDTGNDSVGFVNNTACRVGLNAICHILDETVSISVPKYSYVAPAAYITCYGVSIRLRLIEVDLGLELKKLAVRIYSRSRGLT